MSFLIRADSTWEYEVWRPPPMHFICYPLCYLTKNRQRTGSAFCFFYQCINHLGIWHTTSSIRSFISDFTFYVCTLSLHCRYEDDDEITVFLYAVPCRVMSPLLLYAYRRHNLCGLSELGCICSTQKYYAHFIKSQVMLPFIQILALGIWHKEPYV